MSELVEFLRARLAEDEQAARAATPGRWKLWAMEVRADTDGTSNLDTSLPVATTFHEDGLRTWNADHIARHDPARVLADVEVKRRILDEHFGFLHPAGNPDRACRQCSDRRAEDDPLSHGGNDDRWVKLEPAPCLTVRLLALPYAGHPDYRPEWRPTDPA